MKQTAMHPDKLRALLRAARVVDLGIPQDRFKEMLSLQERLKETGDTVLTGQEAELAADVQERMNKYVREHGPGYEHLLTLAETLPTIDDAVACLFERFCERCEPGENGCLHGETKTACPAFWAIQFLVPDNPFVLRITGRHMVCPRCQKVGMAPPTSAFSTPIQPLLVCQNCAAPFWRGALGMLANEPPGGGKPA
jgi:hypothetical protein